LYVIAASLPAALSLNSAELFAKVGDGMKGKAAYRGFFEPPPWLAEAAMHLLEVGAAGGDGP
jgi:hypothetical protein